MHAPTLEETFHQEAEDTLGRLELGLADMLEGRAHRELLDDVFRAAHNLKGSALGLGRTEVGELAHVVEELLSRWRDGRLKPDRRVTQWALEGVDVLRALVVDPEGGGAIAQAGGEGGAATETHLRVSLGALDGMLDTVGEWIIAAGRCASLFGCLPPESRQAVKDSHSVAESLSLALRDRLMDVRLVPARPFIQRLRRTGEETARKLGKQLSLTVTGEDEKLDSGLLEGLRDPLMHMMRNAVDHGLEDPEQRRAAGKSPEGHLTLSLRKEGGTALLTLEDDGRGLDYGRIAAKARRQGLIGPNSEPSEAELAALIFAPGFSTAEKVTDVSGRGVGLDVVKRNIEALRGSVRVTSRRGKGTVFTISVPLSLAIVGGMLVDAASQSFLVPAERVVACVESVDASDDAFFTSRFEGASLPCVRLDSFLGHRGQGKRPSLLVLSSSAGRIGVLVDELHGEKQAVLKPVGPLLRSLPLITGATVLGTGAVALVLDVDRLAESSVAQWRASFTQASR